jgi:diguanylate cyclase (GGDEF)-like protein/PAS domain S-box-containing protein
VGGRLQAGARGVDTSAVPEEPWTQLLAQVPEPGCAALALFDGAPFGLLVVAVGPDGDPGPVLGSSPEARALVGPSAGRLERRPFLELLDPADRAEAARGLGAVGRGERRSWRGRVRLAGSRRPVLAGAWVGQPEAGRRLLLAQLVDPGPEAAVPPDADADADYRQIVELSREGIITTDSFANITFVNGRLMQMLGYRPEESGEVLGMSIFSFMDEEGVEQAIQNISRQRAGAHEDFEFKVLHRSGEPRWLLARVAPIFDQAGAPRGSVAMVSDVTVQRQAELARRQAEEEFRTAFERAPTGMAMVGLDGTLVRANAALAAMVGRPIAELEGMSLSELEDPDCEACVAASASAVASGEIDSCCAEGRWVTAEGRRIWVSARLAAVRDRQGRPSHLLAHLHETTEAKRQESELRHLAEHDPLTGLSNRRLFRRELEAQVALTARTGEPAAVVLVDLDRFKSVNDAWGHGVGDRVLVAAARALERRLRESDVVARLGGDELAVLLRRVGLRQAVAVARHLVSEVAGCRVQGPGGRPIGATASAGVAPLEPGVLADEVLARADGALYRAKAAGRNRCCWWGPQADGDLSASA